MPCVTPRASFSLPLAGREPLQLGARTLVMGILNVTPDSFSDGGEALDPGRAVERALEMEAAGADIIDVGAESTRPGAGVLDADAELARLWPVLKGMRGRIRVPVSIDTTKAAVARQAIDLGASIVNDVSALGYDPGLGAVVAGRNAALILMHMRGRSGDMYTHAHYDDVVVDVSRELTRGLERAIGAGVAWERVILDPGLGFAKREPHSYAALAGTGRFAALGRPVLVGPSRKSFLAAASGGQPAAGRDWATAAAVTAAVLGGAHIVRVHRVPEMVQVVRVADQVRAAVSGEPS